MSHESGSSFHGEEFLKKKFNLHTSNEVSEQVSRSEAEAQKANANLRSEGKEGPLESEKFPPGPRERIRNYLGRFEEILRRPSDTDPHLEGKEFVPTRERGIEALKRMLRREFVIAPEDIPNSVFLLEQRIARELGNGTVEITDEFRVKKSAEIISNQAASLDKWIDYLSSRDADYPMWAKYWALRSVLEMGKFEKVADERSDKEAGRFAKRTKDTASPFAPLNARALAMTVSTMESRLREQAKPKQDRQSPENISTTLNPEEFERIVSSESFAKLYAQFLVELPEYSAKGLEETRGKWVRYPKGSDEKPLVASLEGYPLEWCTANPDTARNQLDGGDFHVYYSLDQNGDAVIPRAAIRMQDDDIGEVRGIAPGQHLDPFIGTVVGEKVREFPDGEEYEKKVADMKLLTTIEKKVERGEELSKDELRFLYEVDGPISGFGVGSDPRLMEIYIKRDLLDDLRSIVSAKDDQEFAFLAIEQGMGRLVVPRLNALQIRDFGPIATALLDRGHEGVRALLWNIDQFKGVDRSALASSLCKKGLASTVMENLHLFPEFDERQLAAAVLVEPNAETLSILLREIVRFPSVTPEVVAKKVIVHGFEWTILRNIDLFSSQGQILRLIRRHVDESRWKTILLNLETFGLHDLDAGAAELLLQSEKGRQWMAKNLGRFSDIGTEAIDQLEKEELLDSDTAADMKKLKKRGWMR